MLRLRRKLLVVAAVLGIGFGIVLALPCRPVGGNQGCINQGKDCRKFAPVVCWLQRHMSWKSEQQPYFVLIGDAGRASLGLAWPPYLVFNMPDGQGRWHMFRAGFRYDCNWHGYIFPTIAFKSVGRPLRY